MAGICEWVDVGGGLRGYYGEPEGPGPIPVWWSISKLLVLTITFKS